MGASAITGYYVGTEVELRFDVIVVNYLRSWCAFDVFLAGAEWIVIIFDTVASQASSVSLARSMRAARFFRVVRVLRMARLLRLIKFRNLVVQLRERANHELVLMAINVLKLMVITIIMFHLRLACIM